MRNLRQIIAGCSALILMLTFNLFAEFKGEIIPPPDIKGSIVDYGMCFIGDSLERVFILRNTGTEPLRLGLTDPTYFKGQYIPSHPDDYLEFNPPVDSQPPYIIDPGKDRPFILRYYAKDTSLYKAGKKLVLLKLGLHDPKISEPILYKDLVVIDSFLLIARKTTHYIDGYENDWDFDSVYVNPSSKVSWTWQVKNVSNDSLIIDSEELRALSPNPEFEIKGEILPFEIYSRNVRNWEIGYNPKDMGGDSAIYTLSYHPHPIQFPDSIDFALIKLHGIGVKQDLALDFSDVNFYGDTLDFGEVWVGNTKEAIAALKNRGNLKFGTVSQKILKNKTNDADSIFTLTDGIKELPFNLDTLKTDTFSIKFSPVERGTFISRYVINSDISSRNIKGIPAGVLNKIIYLKGTGIAPEISIASDTINFGNVVLHFNCPSTDTIPILINNNGNTTLELQDVRIDPPFTVIPIDTIAANSQRTMKVVFNAFKLGDYTDTLIIVSRNVKPPKDTLKIIVKASSVKPQETRLFIPNDLKAKPGRLISIPVIVDKNNINTARIFSDTLTFNSTILRYYGYENIGTATEGGERALININPINDSSRLSIYIEMPGRVYFLQKDTLIILKFNTYLGDNISTYIAFANPEFGDGLCSKVLTPITANGIFSLDSVCGLSLKAIPFTTKKFRFEDIYPNPANEKIQFEYEMPFASDIKFNMYNSYGELLEKLIDTKLPAGTYQLTYPTGEMTPGVYYFEMQSGLFRKINKVVLTR